MAEKKTKKQEIQIADGWKDLNSITGNDLEKAARQVNPGAFVRSDALKDTLRNTLGKTDSGIYPLAICATAFLSIDAYFAYMFGDAVLHGMPVKEALPALISMAKEPVNQAVLGVTTFLGSLPLLGISAITSREYRKNLQIRKTQLKKTRVKRK